MAADYLTLTSSAGRSNLLQFAEDESRTLPRKLLELNDRLKALGRRMPVVFITAKVERSVLAAVQRSGHAVLKKPLVENGLLEAIAGAIRDQT